MATMTNDVEENVVEQPVRAPVSFDNIDFRTLPFSPEYCWGKSAIGQIMRGLMDIKNNVITQEPNEMTPHIVYVIETLTFAYDDLFMKNTDYIANQVYGANLNGRFNNGQLNRYIFPKMNRRQRSGTRYNNTRIIQLLQLLKFRIAYIINRDITQIRRYQENEEEGKQFVALQIKAGCFMKLLVELITYWKLNLKYIIRNKPYPN